MYKKLVITHDNCVDGCCSQVIFKNLFGDTAEYLPVDHADYNPKFKDRFELFKNRILDVKNTEVYMADICLPPEWIEHFLKQNNKVIILDHHKTAIPFVEPFEERIANGENLNMEIVFSKDNSESGAMLTWKYLNKNQPIPDIVNYVSDGDIWKFNYEETKPFYANILNGREPNDSLPILEELINSSRKKVLSFVEEGKVILEEYMAKVKSYLPLAKPITLLGKSGVIVQAPSEYRSDLGNLLAKEHGGFALLVDEENGVVKCSLRSVAPNIVSDIAKNYGGGGHDQASAFRLNSYEELNNILKENGNSLKLEKQSRKMKLV